MQRTGFSLASLFLVIAVAAVFLAAVRMAVVAEHFESGAAIAVVGAVGPFIGLIVGAVIGAGGRRTGWGLLVALMTGGIAGALAGLLMVVPESLSATAVGAAVIVVFALVVRRLSQKAPEKQ
jgi:hypothetical protein